MPVFTDSSPEAAPHLSVLVTVVSGGDHVRTTLLSLLQQSKTQPWDVEILVPLETSYPRRQELMHEFPDLVFPLAVQVESLSIDPFFVEHERFDRRRAAGLLAARGKIIALCEDHSPPANEWVERVIEAHFSSECAAIGGVVDHKGGEVRNEALWLADFWRYVPPRSPGNVDGLTDINVSYRSADLREIQEVWSTRFHEPLVHEALLQRGKVLRLDPTLVVIQKRGFLQVSWMVRERLAWGRLYGCLRGQNLTTTRRGLLATGVALLGPFVLTQRILRHTAPRLGTWRVVKAAAWLWVLEVFWCLGEARGLVTSFAKTIKPLEKDALP